MNRFNSTTIAARIHGAPSAGMGYWAGAAFPVPQNPVVAGMHPGMGYWAGASFPVPQNPVTAGMMRNMRPGTPVTETKLAWLSGMGYWADARFPVPQNPVMAGRGMGYFGNALSTIGHNIFPPGARLGTTITRAQTQAKMALAAGTPGDSPDLPGLQPGLQGMAGYGPGRTYGPGMGAWHDARFPVPQNPVMAGRKPAGCGCGCNGHSAGGCGGGMGDLSDYLPSLPDMGETFGINNLYLVAGGALVAYVLLARGGEYRGERRAAKAAYSRRIAKARKTYKRGYGRAYDAYQDAVA